MGKVKFRFKKLWFDDARVIRMMNRKERIALNRFGSTVRKHAQYSMKTQKGSAPPGEPPYAHGRKLLKRLLFYSFEPTTKSVIVGPVRLNETKDFHVPLVLEEGGRGYQKTRNGRVIPRQYEARHYMAKAAAPYRGRIAQWYADA